MEASLYLSFFYADNWSARQAVRHLARALRLNSRLLLQSRFWRLLARLAIPPGLAKTARPYWLRRKRQQALGGSTGG
jgi:hypothetical protein